MRAVCAEDFAKPWVLPGIRRTPWAARTCQELHVLCCPKCLTANSTRPACEQLVDGTGTDLRVDG